MRKLCFYQRKFLKSLEVIIKLRIFATEKRLNVMNTNDNIKKAWTREDFLALLERGRQIKDKRLKEAQAKYAERQRRKKEAAESGYYDLEWV